MYSSPAFLSSSLHNSIVFFFIIFKSIYTTYYIIFGLLIQTLVEILLLSAMEFVYPYFMDLVHLILDVARNVFL